MKFFSSLVFIFVLPYGLLSQSFREVTTREEAKKIVIEESGIYAISKDIFDTITVDTRNNAVVYCYAENVKSFWYKIYVTVDSKITFKIYPSNPGNRYNYFLYQHKGDLSIHEVYTTDIAPVRANLYSDKMENGTGLSLSSKVSSNDSCPEDIGKIFYHTPFHSAINVTAGDVLLLNVYHLEGTDCGQHFILKDTKHVQEFQSTYESCCSDLVAEQKNGHFLNPNIVFEPGREIGLFIVRDSTRGSLLDAEITCIKQCQKFNSTVHSVAKGCYNAILEKNTDYEITFSALGYQNKTLTFSTKDSIGSFTQEIRLSLIKKNDFFVMDKIYFYPNTYAMMPGSLSQINQLAAYLNDNPGIKIEIQGHTSGNKRIKKSYKHEENAIVVTEGRFRGSAKKLSQRRAELIKKYLVEKGISGERLMAQGYGGSKMIIPQPHNQEEANKNIRVEVLILSQDENMLPTSSMTK